MPDFSTRLEMHLIKRFTTYCVIDSLLKYFLPVTTGKKKITLKLNCYNNSEDSKYRHRYNFFQISSKEKMKKTMCFQGIKEK